jgi:hypothetical protein
MEFIESWLENNRLEESKLSLYEKGLFITSVEDPYFDVSGTLQDSDASDDEKYFTVNTRRPSGRPFKELALANVIESNTKSAADWSKEFQLKQNNLQLVTSAPPLHDLFEDKKSISLSNKFSNLQLGENKENATLLGRNNAPELMLGLGDVKIAYGEQHKCLEKCEGDDDEGSLILDEFPIMKVSRPESKESLVIAPELMNFNGANSTFYKNLNQIDDESFLPRRFQNHTLKKSTILRQKEPYMYLKNKKCPASSSSKASNFKHYRYSRAQKSHGIAPLQPDYLCRLCRGYNWVPKLDFKTHLAFSHGVLVVNKLKRTYLLPEPKSLFVLRTRSFKTYYAKCNDCGIWMRLGNSSHEEETPQPKKQGLYYNYFLHYIQQHKNHH